MMETYVSESLALRVAKMEILKGNKPIYRDILDVNVYDTSDIVRKSAYDAINSFNDPIIIPGLIAAIDQLTNVKGINVKNARRRIADKLIEDNTYKF